MSNSAFHDKTKLESSPIKQLVEETEKQIEQEIKDEVAKVLTSCEEDEEQKNDDDFFLVSDDEENERDISDIIYYRY